MQKSYIISNYKVSRTTFDYVNSKLLGVSSEERRFFLHLLCSHFLEFQRNGGGVVDEWETYGLSLPSKTIKAEFERGFSWARLESERLIKASEYAKGQCRYFVVSSPVLKDILRKVEEQVSTPDGSPAVNLFDGLGYAVPKALESEGTPSSKLMRDAARTLCAAECPINAAGVQEHLARLERDGLLGKLQNDRMCAQRIFAGMSVREGFGSYTPVYRAQSSGRIGEAGGGVQSCSREMKEAAFSNIEKLFNYDLRCSQGYVLLQELALAGIDGAWLREHLQPGIFEKRAIGVGMSKNEYKKCFFATIMGASHQWLKGEHIGALQVVALEHSSAQDVARVLFDRIVKQLKPLKDLVKNWTVWLLNPACVHLKKTQRREVLENAAGQKMVIDRHQSQADLKRQAAAHILQGQEAAYIHHLTILSKDHGFTPISNQHDGLVTLGEVSGDASAEASRRSGLASAFLIQKSFV